MIDFLVFLFVLAPYVAMLILHHLTAKDMLRMAESISNLSDQIRVLSTHAASMDSKINYWNPYSKKIKGE